jgi:protoporphyrinogen oxidase
MPDTLVIVGAGIAGLTAAWLAAEREPGARIVVVEQAGEPGGLLRSFDYGEFGRFDCGVHVVNETGVAELDRLYESLLPAAEWQLLERQQRDLAGVWFRGRLQSNSHYLDLRRLPADEYRRCLGDFFAHLNLGQQGMARANLGEFALHRFGPLIAREILAPVIRKTYRRSLEEMDELAARLVPLDRVILFDEEVFRPMLDVASLRAAIAYPEQRHFPLELSSGMRNRYPKRYGMHRVIDSLVKRLVARGVSVMTSTRIDAIGRDGARIGSLKLTRGTETLELPAQRLIWTAGMMPLARSLGVAFDPARDFDKPLTTVIVSVLIDRRPQWDGIYYFYCHQPEAATFRVTDFTAFSEAAPRAGGFPLSLELLVEAQAGDTAETYRARGIDELLALGVLPQGTRVLFSKAEVLAAGHPLPTRRNIAGMGALRDSIRALGLENLTLAGILSEPRLFFQTDVLVDLHQKLRP